VGDTKIILTKAREGCTEIRVLVPREDIDNIVGLIAREISAELILEDDDDTARPATKNLERGLLPKGPPIDLGQPDAFDQFRNVWHRAVLIESVMRPWRRLRWLASPSIHSSPIARVISESNERAYTADFSDRWGSFKADLWMACVTWPVFAALLLGLVLLVVHHWFPFIAIGAGVATGLAVALMGAQVCSSVLSPMACGGGTIVMCWAFGLAQAFAIGLSRNLATLSPANVRSDFFISVTGGIVGLSAPDWLTTIPYTIAALLVTAIAFAIAASGWFMAQPIRAGGATEVSRRRSLLASIVGSSTGVGIGLVRLISTVLNYAGCPQHVAFIIAFALIGSATFAFTIQIRRPQLRNGKAAMFALVHAGITCLLCGVAYETAGAAMGLIALSASTGWYQATWFTAASILGNRIASARGAVIATTLEGAVGFTAFILARLLHG
jgi:hypothetical protein